MSSSSRERNSTGEGGTASVPPAATPEAAAAGTGREVPPAGKLDFAAVVRYIIFFGCLIFASYHCYTVLFGMPVAYIHRPVHVLFAATLGFLVYPRNRKRGPGLFDLFLSAVALATFIVPILDADQIAERLVMVDELTTIQTISGVSAIILVLILIYRAVGAALVAVCGVFLAYAFLGIHAPGSLAHKGFEWFEIVDYLGFGLEGLYSSAIGVSATYIAAFIMFGTFLERCGAGELLMDLGRALAGQYRGGPAKISVITSAFFGSISGSAAANVYATGPFTVPMMKRVGYSATFAGAVEAASSTGGQLIPPVMGAAAFMMADTMGIPFIEICKAALIPSFLFFLSVMMMVDFEAAKTGLAGLPKEELPRLRDALKKLYLLLPMAVLLAIMIMGYTPFRAAVAASGCAILVSWTDRRFAIGPRRLIEILSTSGRRLILIAVACLGAGIVIGVVSLTGIGLNLAAVVLSIAGGSTLKGLIVVMLASILVGMGTPTTVAYVLVATLGVPALRELGFDLLPSHFFVFYFGVIAMVTPPVAVAAYAAAEVAGSSMMRTSIAASRLCTVAFIVPFFFMYDPALLMQGDDWLYIIYAVVTASIGTVALAGAIERWFFRPLPWPLVPVLFLGACSLIVTGYVTDIIGFATVFGIGAYCWLTKTKTPKKPSVPL